MVRHPTMASTHGRLLRVPLALGLLIALAAPPGVAAQGTLEVSTPYPAISVQPGASANFEIHLTSSEPRTVDLAVSGTPDGWTAELRGGGFTVDSVFVTRNQEPDLTLDVKIPSDAPDGTTRLTVTARSGSVSDSLVLQITVAMAAGGSVALTTDVPSQRGRSDQTFTFTLHLDNDTPQELTFTLNVTDSPEGWTVEARPATQTQAASFTIDAGGSETVNVTVTPAEDAASASYPISVQAAAGAFSADASLSVEIVGNVALSLTTPDGRLSTSGTAGATKDFTLRVSNTGTSPSTAITMSETAPKGWNVTFEPETIESLAAGADQDVVAHITPSGDAVAGDYMITFKADSAEANESAEVRMTVESSPQLLVAGGLIIVLVLLGLYWVFQRYGRR